VFDRFFKLVTGYFIYNASRATAVAIENTVKRIIEGEDCSGMARMKYRHAFYEGRHRDGLE